MHYTTLLVDTVAPFSTLALQVSSSTPLASLESEISARYPNLPYHALSLASPCGLDLSCDAPLSTLADGGDLVTLRLMPSLLGGKGGFGSQLRAAGGRMSSQKASNNDSCRDLNGRKLSTIKEAKKMATYLEAEPERKKAAAEEKRAKLEALEKQLGITPGESSKDGEPPVRAGQKHRFDDIEYLEQSREITDGVKSAVAAGLLKKRKKNKVASAVEPTSTKAVEPAAAPEPTPAEAPASEVVIETTAPAATSVIAASA
ncbi:telomere stability/silencing protein [Rhizoctonia solani AG-3 Rhs1AP]|uniref:Telomere stability/silencing protein n=2 Tax=Rhizoctonia solani AG-3 TaxID=1086053 RepID=A0A074S057_9AGAM|nr:telomere stability/silencing protein [Rhizoctonia solani AG-3 Rhs1AP]KEP52644.1 telomere stability/silencing protein [Rhizoctonia solani 123E]